MWKLSREKALLFRQKVQVTGKFCVIAVDAFLFMYASRTFGLQIKIRSQPKQKKKLQMAALSGTTRQSSIPVQWWMHRKEQNTHEYNTTGVICCRGTSQSSFIYTSLKNVLSVGLVVSLYLFFIKAQVQITVGLPGNQPFRNAEKTQNSNFLAFFLQGKLSQWNSL